MKSWRKYHWPALTSGISAVQISAAPFLQPVMFRPPLSRTFAPGAAA